MIVAGVQADCVWEEPDANFQHVRDLLQQTSSISPRLIALPEMFATGFSMRPEVVAPHSETTRNYLSGLAREQQCWVLGGFAEPGENRPHNSCAIFNSDGEESLHYRKIHLFSFAGEHEKFSAGEVLPTVTVEGVRVTAAICYDLRFPELFRAVAARTDLFIVIANWPQKRRDAWCGLLRARAMENQTYVLGVNRVGEGDGLEYSGDSCLLGPRGQVIAAAAGGATVFAGPVDAAEVAKTRQKMTILTDRRPGLYRRLEQSD